MKKLFTLLCIVFGLQLNAQVISIPELAGFPDVDNTIDLGDETANFHDIAGGGSTCRAFNNGGGAVLVQDWEFSQGGTTISLSILANGSCNGGVVQLHFTYPPNTPLIGQTFDLAYLGNNGSGCADLATPNPPQTISLTVTSAMLEGTADNTTTQADYDSNCVAGAAAAPAEVPTLSEWGLLILALLLMTTGTLYLLQTSRRNSILD